MNEFEQVSGDSHQISLAGELASEVPCPTSGGGQGQAWGVSGPCLEGGWAWARGDPSDCMTTGLIQGQGKEKGSMGLNIS